MVPMANGLGLGSSGSDAAEEAGEQGVVELERRGRFGLFGGEEGEHHAIQMDCPWGLAPGISMSRPLLM